MNDKPNATYAGLPATFEEYRAMRSGTPYAPKTLEESRRESEKLEREEWEKQFGIGERTDGAEENYDPQVYTLTRSRRGYPFLRVVREDGSGYLLDWQDITAAEFSPDFAHVTLCLRGRTLLTLSGDRLASVVDHVQSRTLYRIERYRPEYHRLPHPDAPVIRSIEERSLKE